MISTNVILSALSNAGAINPPPGMEIARLEKQGFGMMYCKPDARGNAIAEPLFA